jgi:hypothetical protein
MTLAIIHVMGPLDKLYMVEKVIESRS